VEGDEQHTISGLLRKRTELERENAECGERMAGIANDLEAIDRVLDAFGYGGPLEGRTPRAARIVLFYRNELHQFLQAELAKADRPMSTRDLAEVICQSEGKDAHHWCLLADVIRRASKARRQMRGQGIVASDQNRRGTFVWSVPSTGRLPYLPKDDQG
jgi:hypothetical protein